MAQSDPPKPVIDAVRRFVNAGGVDELEKLVVSHRTELLSDEGDRVMQHLLGTYGQQSEQELSHLRIRRGILLRCREVGIEVAFHPTSEFQKKRETVLSFLNTRDSGDSLRFVQEYEALLLSDEVEPILRDIAFDFRDDPQIQKFIHERGALLENCRHRGIRDAFSGQVIEIREEMGRAIMMFIEARSFSDVRRVLEENQELLMTDEGEQTLSFIAEGASAGGDERAKHMQSRLGLLRNCRALGIESVFDSNLADQVISESVAGISHVQDVDNTAANQELDAALQQVMDAEGAIQEADLRALLEKRPELASALRTRFETGEAIFLPPTDRTGIEEVIAAIKLAEQTGRWSDIIPIARAALQKVTKESAPEIWAMLQESLGTALSRTPHGDRAKNLDEAIEHHEFAGQVFRSDGRDEARQLWAVNEHHLALAYLQRVRGDRAENIEKAIALWRNLIQTFGDKHVSLEWPASLGDALRQRLVGNPSENVEEAIGILTNVVTRADDISDTDNAGRARIALGLAYSRRLSGDPAENVEQAISLLELGIRQTELGTDVGSWANVQRSLAGIYLERQVGDPRENWKTAAALLHAVEDRCQRDGFPEQWAETRLLLASLHANKPEGRNAGAFVEAIRMMESTLEVYTRRDFPYNWAKTHTNIASLYATLFNSSEDTTDYFEQSVKHVNEALEVYTREATPARWALLHRTLGKLNLHRAELSSEEDRGAFAQNSIEHFERALDAADAIEDDSEKLEILEFLSALYFRQRDWTHALQHYVEAMRCSDRLLGSAHTEVGQMLRASESNWMYGRAAYCLLQLNDPKASLLCVEWGRTRILAQTLAMRDLDIAQLPSYDRDRIAALRATMRTLESDARAERKGGNSFVKAAAPLSRIRKQLEDAIAQVQATHPHFLRTRVKPDEIYDATPNPGALVAPLITDEGSVVYIVLKNEAGELQHIHLSINWLHRDLIRGLLVGSPQSPGWLRQYRAWQRGSVAQSAWRATMDTGLSLLWTYLIQGVSEILEARLPEGAPVTMLLPGELSFFPFHAASANGGSCGSLIDRFSVSYAPSIYALLAGARRLRQRDRAPIKFVGILNPTGDLPYADSELDGLTGVIPTDSQTLFHRHNAQFSELRACIGTATHLHMACHGIYDSDDIMRSGLLLADSTMTMEEIMRPELQLTTRLVTLSACESGRIDVKYSADEFIGLPGAFLQGGACGVLSTLWPVADRATGLLINRFYRAHLVDGLSPASALRRAQLWLRDATREQIADSYRSLSIDEESHAAYVDMILGGNAEEQPYKHPFYWGAFQFTGV